MQLQGVIFYGRHGEHALRRTAVLDPISQRRLEELVDRWILDPSSFIGPNGDLSTLYETGRN